MKEQIREWIKEYVTEYMEENSLGKIWREPLAGFADARSEYIRRLPELVMPQHKQPEDFLPDARIVIVYFLPFSKAVADSNVGTPTNDASKGWADGYLYTDGLLRKLNPYLVKKIQESGYQAVIPAGISMQEDILKSCWSQRHLAYAAGLGTFGINNMLITRQGCCGRYSSIVTDIPVTPDSPLKEELCLYKWKGICKKCVDNCYSGALTEQGFDRFKCYEACMKNIDVYGVDVCGKCTTGIPCAFAAPRKIF